MISRDDVIKGVGGQLVRVLASRVISGHFNSLVIDSREVTGGDLFIALRGEHDDGHNHIADAISKGVGGILAERVPDDLAQGDQPTAVIFLVKDSLTALQSLAKYWRNKHKVGVIGITGSVGKTTTKELIAALLSKKYQVLKNEGNLNNEIGLPLSLMKLDDSHERAVLEMGMYAIGEIELLCEIAQPKIGVVTNVGYSHFGRLESLERIAEAKSELIQSLPVDGVAILNGDDERVRAFRHQTRARVLLYGLRPGYDVWASELIGKGLEGGSFVLHRGKESILVETALPGQHNVHNALAAAAVAFAEGFSMEETAAFLGEAGSQLRLVPVPGVKDTTIIDDTYNASPASMLSALDVLAALQGRKIAVLGDMFELGSFEKEGHSLVGRRVAQVAQVLVAVGERGRILGKEAKGSGLPQVVFAATNEEAVEALLPLLLPGDNVLIKGSRGMAMEQIVERLKR